jgi:uncharacterized protein (TIGR02118 family)
MRGSKIVTVVARAASLPAEQFHALYRAELESFAARWRSVLQRCIVNLVDVPAEEAGLDPASTPAAPYDVVLETWWDSLENHRQLEELHAGAARSIGAAHSYHVRETVQKAGPEASVGRSPGIKGIYAVRRRPDLTHEAFARHWREVHGPLALRHHVGMSKYVQDLVLRPFTPAAPEFDGFSELHFPTARDLRERFVDSPEGGRRIADDVARFVGSAVRLDATEYVVQA